MQSTYAKLRWSLRSCLVLTLLLAVMIISAVQVAHWCGHDGTHTIAGTAQASEGICPVCYSVPVSHGMAPAALNLFCQSEQVAESITPPQQQGIQPEFHLHTRPPPTAA